MKAGLIGAGVAIVIALGLFIWFKLSSGRRDGLKEIREEKKKSKEKIKDLDNKLKAAEKEKKNTNKKIAEIEKGIKRVRNEKLPDNIEDLNNSFNDLFKQRGGG